MKLVMLYYFKLFTNSKMLYVKSQKDVIFIRCSNAGKKLPKVKYKANAGTLKPSDDEL